MKWLICGLKSKIMKKFLYPIVLVGALVLTGSSFNQADEQTQKKSHQKQDTDMKQFSNSKENTHKGTTHAKATTTVYKYEPVIYDDPKEGPALVKAHLEESFTGDIKADGVVEILQATNHANESSVLVGIERMTGKIGEKQGSFLLQIAGKIEGKAIKCDWFVIPGSGTGQLTGLRGEGGFEAKLGKGGECYLDYWFE